MSPRYRGNGDDHRPVILDACVCVDILHVRCVREMSAMRGGLVCRCVVCACMVWLCVLRAV